MKTRLLFTLLFLPIMGVFAQAVVSAPVLEKTAFRELGETLKQTAEATKQTSKLQQSYQLLKDTYDAVEKVSSQVQNIKLIGKILDSQTEAIKYANSIYNKTYELERLDESLGEPTSYPQRMREAIHTVMGDSEDYLDMLKKLTTTGTFKMTDAERINLIFEIEEKINWSYKRFEHLEEQLDEQIKYSKYSEYLEKRRKGN